MATQRIDSGQVQLRGAGFMPANQPQVGQVDFVAGRVQANASQTLAQALDRMSAQINQDAFQMRQQEGLQWAAENPLTPEQFEAAKNGKPIDLGGNKFGAFGQAVLKARSLELSGHFEMEGMNQLVQIQNSVEQGLMSAQDAATKIQEVTNGLGKSVAAIDGDAAYKFRAQMATQGNAVLQSVYRIEMNKVKQQRIAKFDMSFDNAVQLLETAAQENPDTFTAYGDAFKENILGQSMLLGDASIQKEYSGKVGPAIKNAQINAISKFLMQDEFMGDYRGTIARLRSGDLDKYSGMIQRLMKTDFETYQKIESKFTEMVRARKEGIDLAFVDSNGQAEDLLRQIYVTTDGGKQRSLLKQLQALPTSAEIQKKARDFVYSDSAAGPQTDDLIAFGRLSQRVALGQASADEIAKAPLTRATKKQLMTQWANPNDDVSYGTNQINLAVGIQSSNLPPELKSAEARQLAVETRNNLVMELTNYARTPNEKGVLPAPSDIRAKGAELASKASKGMSKAFTKAAEANSNTAVMMLPELQGVDLNDNTAVEAAIAKAVKAKRNQTNINAAKSAIDDYRANQKKVQEGQQ